MATQNQNPKKEQKAAPKKPASTQSKPKKAPGKK